MKAMNLAHLNSLVKQDEADKSSIQNLQVKFKVQFGRQMFFLDSNPSSLDDIRKQIFKKINKSEIEFQQKVRIWQGENNLRDNLEIIWRNESKRVILSTEIEFENMISTISKSFGNRNANKSTNLDLSDLDGSFMSMKYQMGNSLKKIKIIAKIPDQVRIESPPMMHVKSMKHTPAPMQQKQFGSDSKNTKRNKFQNRMSVQDPNIFSFKEQESVPPETPQLGAVAKKPKKFMHSKTIVSSKKLTQQGSFDLSAKPISSTGFMLGPSKSGGVNSNEPSVINVLGKYAKILQNQLPSENKVFSEMITKNRIPCQHCFDFENPDKQLGCKHCHKKGYFYVDFQTEVFIHLISSKLRSWLLNPIQALVEGREFEELPLSREASFAQQQGNIFIFTNTSKFSFFTNFSVY